MGQIWRAWDQVLQREVAVKVLLPGADRQRFLIEARISGQLSHPAIPPVHTLGELADGTPFLVMKLIQGETLAQALKRRQQPLENLGRWLDILEQVARAVGFAHAHGIVHRDLKPSNIMIGEFGEAQVMDWGLAKRIVASANAHSPNAHPPNAHPPATSPQPNHPESSSPRAHPATAAPPPSPPNPATAAPFADEPQSITTAGSCPAVACAVPLASNSAASRTEASSSSGDPPAPPALCYRTVTGHVLGTPAYMAPEQACGAAADPRADVFALGSILTEILTGAAVFQGGSVQTLLVQAATGDTQAALHRLRGCSADPELIQLACDCLAVDPLQRPATGWAVAERLACYRHNLEQRLRQAETERATQHIRMLERRRRLRLLTYAGALVLGLLFAGLGGILLSLIRAHQAAQAETLARQEAQRNQQRARAAAAAARRAQQLAETRLQQAETAQQQAEVHARQSQQREAESRALLEFLEKNILGSSQLQGIESGLTTPITLHQLLDFALADLDTLFPDHPHLQARLYQTLGRTYLNLGQPQTAETLLRTAHQLYVCCHRPHDLAALQTLNQLAIALFHQGRYHQAHDILEPLYHYLLHHYGAEHRTTLEIGVNLAVHYGQLGHFDRALTLQTQIREHQLRSLGPDDPQTLLNLNNLATTFAQLGRLDQAQRLLEELVQRRESTLGPLHVNTIAARSKLADNLMLQNKTAQALHAYQQLFFALSQRYGPNHPQTLHIHHKIVHNYFRNNQPTLALEWGQQSVKLTTTHLGPYHHLTISAQMLLADIYAHLQRYPEALRIQHQLLPICKQVFGPQHDQTLRLLSDMAWNCAEAGDLDQALQLFEQAITIRTHQFSRDPNNLANLISLAGFYCNRAHQLRNYTRFSECFRDYQQAITLLTTARRQSPQHPTAILYLRNCHWGRALAYELLQQYSQADADWRLALDLCAPAQHANLLQDWHTQRQRRSLPVAPPPRPATQPPLPR